MKKEKDDVELELTNEDLEIEQPELEDIEEKSGDKLKQLRDKLSHAEEEKRNLQDELQRARADFLNAKRRLEEERAQDKVRLQKKHVAELLPLCDSFQMAMSDTEAWEKADAAWRKGVEGINVQLMQILTSYGVRAVDPTGEEFDPHKHEAVGMTPTDNTDQHDTVLSVMQRGYEMTHGDTTELIRPARVIIGTKQD